MINKLKLYIIMICRLELGLQNNLELKNIKNIKKNQFEFLNNNLLNVLVYNR